MSAHVFGHQSYFSTSQSIQSPKALVESAHKAGLEAVAIADENSINSLADLSKACKEYNIKPIIGVSISVVDSLSWRKPKANEKKTKNPEWRPTLYVKNEAGFKDILWLLSLANDKDHYYFKPQITLEELCGTLGRGNLFCTLGTTHSVFTHKDCDYIVNELISCCNQTDLLAELCPVDQLYYDRHNKLAIDAIYKYEISSIFSRPSFYKKDQNSLRTTVNCIMSNDTRESLWRRETNESLHVMDDKSFLLEIKGMMNRLKGEFPNNDYVNLIKLTMANQRRVVSELTFEWRKLDPCLPSLSSTPFQTLKGHCIAGFKDRLTSNVLGYVPEKKDLPKYQKRLAYELGIIGKMGFSDYFLLVHELVNWCKTEGIVVGPGRGSVGGSLIAFLMGITDVDPIRFGLIFERFINPDRIDLPDIDLDFMSSRRMEIIERLTSKFGDDHVAGISNYSILGPASALRSVAKAHNLPESEYACSKMIPKIHGNSMTLEESVTEVPDIEKFAINHPYAWEEACQAQGIFRNYGQHAAGIVVAGEPIRNRAVLENRKGERIINWDKRVVEDFGLIKLDVLGLTTLDVLAIANDYIEKQTGSRVDYTEINLDDEKVLDGFGRGETTGVFQFESNGMKHLLRSLAEDAPLTFEDITAATALFRPGPMESGLKDDFVNIKQGNSEPYYLHENMRPALEETSSVIVYQEQVMRIARDLAGFTMTESDHLRKAMGKKDPEMMAKQRDKWVNGCVEHSGIDEGAAERLFDQVESFAGYAFNKSHSVEYTIISYWAMWLKTYHPEIFYASTMSVLDKIEIAKDAEAKNIYVVPPDINHSSDKFEIGYDSKRQQSILYAPFNMIKGVSANGSKAILRAKEKMGRPFVTKQEFVDTVERRLCNIRVQDALDKVGAFAEIENQLPARHPDRLKDQKQLMPTVMTESVKADRKIETSNYVKKELISMVDQCRSCERCTLAGESHPTPRLGRSPKIMIVTDCPNWSEGDACKMGEGVASKPLKLALDEAGLKWSDVYMTSLVKAPKPKGGEIQNEMINGCSDYLAKEIDLLKPPVIVALGGKAARHLHPELKGKWDEICGEETYLSKIDATLVVGMNPMMISFDDSKQTMLNKVMHQCAMLIN